METESSRRLRQSLEAGLRRVAEARERGELSSPIYDDEEKEDLSGLSVGEILDLGRARAVANAEREAAASASGLASRADAASVSGSPTKLANQHDVKDPAFCPIRRALRRRTTRVDSSPYRRSTSKCREKDQRTLADISKRIRLTVDQIAISSRICHA